nr:hypothetical protein [Rhizobium leguminosarum]
MILELLRTQISERRVLPVLVGVGVQTVTACTRWEMYRRARSRAERDTCREEARAAGARVVLCFLDVPFDALWDRVSRRNAELPAGTFDISRATCLEHDAEKCARFSDDIMLYFFDLHQDSDFRPIGPKIILI